MGRTLRLASGIVIGMSAVWVVGLVPVRAQAPAPAPVPGREYSLGKQERAALNSVQAALAVNDYAGAAAAITLAQSAVSSADGRYLLGSLQVRVGTQNGNRVMQEKGIEAMLASGSASAAETNQLLKNQAAMAYSAGDRRKTESALSRLLDRDPNDLDALIGLAEIRAERKRIPEAITLVDRAIEIRRAAGQPVPESWYKFEVRIAYDSRATAQAMKTTKQWITAYPSPENWRDALENLRDLTAPDRETDVDIWRAMRATRSLAGERDYLAMSDLLKQAGYAAEAKSVTDEATSAKILEASRVAAAPKRKGGTAAASKKAGPAAAKPATSAPAGSAAVKAADAAFGAGDYAKAADMYRTALADPAVDVNLVNTRLGLALGLAGRRAEAEPALRAVAGGPRAELASLLLIWLAQRG